MVNNLTNIAGKGLTLFNGLSNIKSHPYVGTALSAKAAYDLYKMFSGTNKVVSHTVNPAVQAWNNAKWIPSNSGPMGYAAPVNNSNGMSNLYKLGIVGNALGTMGGEAGAAGGVLGGFASGMAFPAAVIGGGYTLANFINGLYNAAALKRVNANLDNFQQTGNQFYNTEVPTNRTDLIDYMTSLKLARDSIAKNQNNLDSYRNYGSLVQADPYTNQLVGDMSNAVNDARYQTGSGVRSMTNLGDLSKYNITDLKDKYTSLQRNMGTVDEIRNKLYETTNYKYLNSKGQIPAGTDFSAWVSDYYNKPGGSSVLPNSQFSGLDYVNGMNQLGVLDNYIKNYKEPLQGSATTNATGTTQPPSIPPLIPGGVNKDVPPQPTNWDTVLNSLMKNTNTVNNNTTYTQDNTYPLIPYSMLKMPILQSLFR
jgi:hypothetical protein